MILRLTYASTTSKVSKYGDFSGPYFPVFGLNTGIYSVNLLIQPDYWKIRTRKTPHLDTFHAVLQPPSVIHAAFNTILRLLRQKRWDGSLLLVHLKVHCLKHLCCLDV